MKQKIFPSVVAKNQKELDTLLRKLKGVAKTLHLDVVDGKFAPNHSLDFNFRLSRSFKYNVHLMIKNPEKWIIKHGKKVSLCYVQLSEIKDLEKYIVLMRKLKKKVAIALKPESKVSSLKAYINQIDHILILTVHPGFYGGKYLKGQLRKVEQIKKLNLKIKMVIDGHMNLNTIKEAQKAGADHFVSGSFVSLSNNPRKAIQKLRAILNG